jgi:hypothetical protein
MIIGLIITCAVLFSRLIGGCVKTAICVLLIGFLFYRYPELHRDVLTFCDAAVHKLEEALQDL